MFFLLCLVGCVPVQQKPLYFSYEHRTVCVSKSLLIKLFPEYISRSIGDESTALFVDKEKGVGAYVLLQRQWCWEFVDMFPFSQKVLQIKLLKSDSLVVWYELYPECVTTQSYHITMRSITPY